MKMKWTKMHFRHVGISQQGALNALMNLAIKKKLNVPKIVTRGGYLYLFSI